MKSARSFATLAALITVFGLASGASRAQQNAATAHRHRHASPVVQTYEKFDPKDVKVTFVMTAGQIAYSAGVPTSIEGATVQRFAIGDIDVELATNTIDLQDGHLVFTTKKFGKIRIESSSNFGTTLWVTASQKKELLRLAKEGGAKDSAQFVPVPSDIGCSLESPIFAGAEGGQWKLQTVQGVTCWMKDHPDVRKEIPITSAAVTNGQLSTVQFGDLQITGDPNVGIAMAINSSRLGTLRVFLQN